jgi:hypothetical protein
MNPYAGGILQEHQAAGRRGDALTIDDMVAERSFARVVGLSQPAASPRPELGPDSLRTLYGEVARGRLERYLDANPALVSMATAVALRQDIVSAIEYGDTQAAITGTRACAEILDRMGDHRSAVALQIDMFNLRLGEIGTDGEYLALRRQALAVAARAQDAEWAAAQAECWLIAAECSLGSQADARATGRPAVLMTCLRDLADISELLALQPSADLAPAQLLRLARLLASASSEAFAHPWAEHELLEIRTLLRRAGRTAERILPGSLFKENGVDAAADRRMREQLTRLFMDSDR